MDLDWVCISFPDIPLRTRDGHKLRGFFGSFFKEYSPLLHNHFQNGTLRYAYPLVQYKVIDKVAHLIGLQEGAELLIKLFLNIRKINIDGQEFRLEETAEIKTYSFITPWMALNQSNYQRYINSSPKERTLLLNRIVIGNILSFYKYIGMRLSKRLEAMTFVHTVSTMFKGHKMIAFTGYFSVNAILPDLIGIGKSVSRGFGAIQAVENQLA